MAVGLCSEVVKICNHQGNAMAAEQAPHPREGPAQAALR